jgi:hypothetical protein
MSTRALAEVYDEDGKILVSIYKHWDGYPEGFGADLEEICKKYTLVNGLGGRDNTYNANGMGCFAATLIKTIKEDAGDVYIQAPSKVGGWEEYIYRIEPVGDKIKVTWREV